MEPPLNRLRTNAMRCRDLALTAMSPEAKDVLIDLAEQYEHEAIVLADSGALRHRRPAFKWPLS